MSKKNLAKTSIEGGRHSGNKSDRYLSHATERAETKLYLSKVKLDPSYADEEAAPVIEKVRKEFLDKLSPMYRWLSKQIGKKWDDVKSELIQKFDSRTTAGRHILYDHLLSEVLENKDGFDDRGHSIDNANFSSVYYHRVMHAYYVDQEGILCENEFSYRKNRNNYKKIMAIKNDFEEIANWLNGNLIVKKQSKLYWCLPTDGIWKCFSVDPLRKTKLNTIKYYILSYDIHNMDKKAIGWWNQYLPYNMVYNKNYYWKEVDVPFSFKQRGELNSEELNYFNNLSERMQEYLLSFSKGI